MDEDKRIVLENLNVRYSGMETSQLKNININTPIGQIIGIVGNSHSGKSTLCRVLAGIIPKIISATISGTYTIAGRSPMDDWTAFNTSTGVVLQNPAGQLSGLADTVADELAFDLINQGTSADVISKRVANVAAQMGLTDQLRQKPESLSGGQMQRLAIATAIITQPQILIMDDPTSEMDPVGRQQFFHWLTTVKDTTVFIVSSEIDDLCEVADSIWIMSEGELVSQGSPQDVFNHLSPEWQIPTPTVYQMAEKMNWRLTGDVFPVAAEELKEAFDATN
ncbi:ABC transporter ATP-binding protein [Lentilactobacillus sunkii]|nr:ABC transporter ATP-binding protein [Lentilactobacillus sunkii]